MYIPIFIPNVTVHRKSKDDIWIYDHSKLHITSIVSERNGIVCQNEDPRQVVGLKWPNKPLAKHGGGS